MLCHRWFLLRATDIYGTRDLDYGTPVNINSTGTLASYSYSGLPWLQVSVAPLLFIQTEVLILTLTGSATGLTSTPSSNPFDIIIANASDIVLDGTFSETQTFSTLISNQRQRYWLHSRGLQ